MATHNQDRPYCRASVSDRRRASIHKTLHSPENASPEFAVEHLEVDSGAVGFWVPKVERLVDVLDFEVALLYRGVQQRHYGRPS